MNNIGALQSKNNVKHPNIFDCKLPFRLDKPTGEAVTGGK